MENESIQNQQNISEGQGFQVNNPTAPVIQGNGGTFVTVVNTPSPSEPTVSGTPHNLPYSGATAFIGREDDLERLHEQLQTETTIAISSISGMGGIGKTELAWQYANQQLTSETPPSAVCWLRARKDLGAQILAFGQEKLGLRVQQEWDFARQVTFCWEHLRQSETLVIFDDVQSFEDIRSFLTPVSSSCKILLTTRSRFGAPAQPFEIKVLTEAQSLDLLRALTADRRIDADLETAKAICHWLGKLPLGLELVGRYLARKPDTSVAILWERLQAKRLEAIALKQAAPEMTAELGVAAAFELSWQELDELAQRVAAFLSLFALSDIPWTLVQAGLLEEDPEKLEEVRDRKLVDLSLLQRSRQGMYELHQLLREFFAAKREQMANADEMKQDFCGGIVKEIKQIPQTLTLSAIEKMAPTIPHFKEAATTLHTWLADDDLIRPSTCIAWFYQEQAAYSEVEDWYDQCKLIVRERLGSNHLHMAATLNNQAVLYRRQGRYEKAKSLYLESLEIARSRLSDNHPDVVEILDNLAVVCMLQGRYDEAEFFYESSDLRDHLDLAKALSNRATLRCLQGRNEEAEPLFERAISIRESQLGQDHLDVAMSLNNLVAVYYEQGRYDKAEDILKRSLSIRQQQLDDDHPYVGNSLHNLAMLYTRQGRYREAELRFLRALQIFSVKLGEEHPSTQEGSENFRSLLQKAIQEHRTDELSDDPMTQSILQELQNTSD
jgi:tetratricopeptide (TPR) repeat protein